MTLNKKAKRRQGKVSHSTRCPFPTVDPESNNRKIRFIGSEVSQLESVKIDFVVILYILSKNSKMAKRHVVVNASIDMLALVAEKSLFSQQPAATAN